MREEMTRAPAYLKAQFSSTTKANQIYVRLSKPPAYRGFLGLKENSNGKDGSVEVLCKIYLKQFVDSILNGVPPKKAIMYVKKLEHLADVNEFLKSKLGHLDIVKNPDTIPWVINWTNAGKVTIAKIRERSSKPDGGI